MQFEKKTRAGSMSGIAKLLIKVVLFFLALLIVVVLIDRIDFPSPIKKIEKIIPNENFKILIFFLINPLNAENEPIDIWELEEKVEPNESQLIIEEDNSISNSIIQIETDLNTKINTLKISHDGDRAQDEHDLNIKT